MGPRGENIGAGSRQGLDVEVTVGVKRERQFSGESSPGSNSKPTRQGNTRYGRGDKQPETIRARGEQMSAND